jgi:hypothetical protein
MEISKLIPVAVAEVKSDRQPVHAFTVGSETFPPNSKIATTDKLCFWAYSGPVSNSKKICIGDRDYDAFNFNIREGHASADGGERKPFNLYVKGNVVGFASRLADSLH